MKIDPVVLEAIKNMDLPSLVRSYGIELKPAGKNAYLIHCPFHEDKTPSLSVGYRNNKWMWNCFGCRAHGNSLDFRIAYEKISFSEAYQKWEAELHLVSAGTNGDGSAARPLTPTASINNHSVAVPAKPAHQPTPTTINRAELLTRAVQIYHEALQEDRRGINYLAGRGIKDGEFLKRFKIGYVNGRLRRILPEDPGHEFNRGLKEVGILNDKGREHFHGCVVFPIFDDNGAVVGMYGRRVSALAFGPDHLYLPGPRQGVWNGAAVKAHKEIILAESIIDAASFHALGYPNAVALYGVNGLTEGHLALFREHRTRRVVLCLDNDKAGDEARARVKEKITLLGVEVVDMLLPRQYKDVNVALKHGITPEELRGHIPSEKRGDDLAPVSAGPTPVPQATTGAPPSLVPPVVANPPNESIPKLANPVFPPVPMEPASQATELVTPPLTAPIENKRVEEKSDGGHVFPVVEEREDGIYMSFGRRRYRVRGLTGKNLESLKVNVKVEAPDGNHMDTLDLYVAKSRGAFVACCRKIFEAGEGELLGELNKIIVVLEGIQGKLVAGGGDEKIGKEMKKISPEEERAALAALGSATLMEDIVGDMTAVGYVGEEANKAIGYLVGVSRKLEDPMSCVVISQSSAGKSVLAETVERLTPPEDVLLFSRVTPQALYYMDRDALKGKLLIIEERVGAEGADYSIRTLQSRKKLTQAVPIKDPNTGKIRTVAFEVEGPMAYIETTTRPRIHDENATRCFELYLDESMAQTQRIHERQREGRTLGGLMNRSKREGIMKRHWNMQRLLRPVKVVTPYAHLLEFPVTWLRTRRDNVRFLNLIEVVTFLHQHQRPMEKTQPSGGEDYIRSTVGDYRTAYNLARQVLGESFTELKKPQRELLTTVDALILSTGTGEVTRREIRERTGLADTRLRELLSELVSLEYLQDLGGGQGRASRYRMADRSVSPEKILAGLTTPEELEKKLTDSAPHAA